MQPQSNAPGPDDVLDVIPVRCRLYWPDETVVLRVGWRKGEANHWVYIVGDDRMHEIDRDLFLRLRAYLLLVGPVEL